MHIRDLMKRIKINGYYVLDECNELNLKEYYPVKVKVLRKEGRGYYSVMPIEPIAFPIVDGGYAFRPIVVHKKYLSKTTYSERIVIRCPINMPRFNKADDIALTKIINDLERHKYPNRDDITRLKIVLQKLRYVETFSEVNL